MAALGYKQTSSRPKSTSALPPGADIQDSAGLPVLSRLGHSLIYGFSDAVADLGVTHLDMPLTPETVWRAIRDPKSCDPTRLMGDLD